MKRILSFLFLSSVSFTLWAQLDQWAWMKGDTIFTQNSIYGTKGEEAVSNKPAARSHAFTWTDTNGKFWLFGGNFYPASDLWKFDPQTNNWTWISGDTSGLLLSDFSGKPGIHWGGCSWRDNDGNFWMFGGRTRMRYPNEPAQYIMRDCNELWKYNVTTNSWTFVKGDTGKVLIEGYPPYESYGAYGTKGIGSASNRPGGRVSPSAWKDASGNLWMFGGQGWTADPKVNNSVGYSEHSYLNDLWKFDPYNNNWTWMGGDSLSGQYLSGQFGIYGAKGISSIDNKPGSRREAASWTDSEGNLWLFGGLGFSDESDNCHLNDLWKYNPSTNTWTWMHGSKERFPLGIYGTMGVGDNTTTPGGRYGAATWTDNAGNFWLYGGFGTFFSFGRQNNRTPLHDLWKYDPRTNVWTWIRGSNEIQEAARYNHQTIPNATSRPGYRWNAQSWYSDSTGIWLFGGTLGSTTQFGNDLWNYLPAPELAFRLIDPNPSLVVASDTLNADLSKLDRNKKVTGAAADSVTRLVLYSDWNAPIKFSLPASGHNGSLSSFTDQNNPKNEITIEPVDGKVAVIYRAPDGFGPNPLKLDHRTLEVRMEDLVTGNIRYIPIKLYTPPVVLIHGMWSGPAVWDVENFTTALQQNGISSYFKVDYEKHNFKTFDPYLNESLPARTAVQKKIKEALNFYRKRLGVAVSQVDIVAHSLGALIARSYATDPILEHKYYSSDNCFKGYIHKLISLASPHNGSPFGPELYEHRNDWVYIPIRLPYGIPLAVPLETLLGDNKKIGSCHQDFALGSTALMNLAATPPFKTHAITADADQQFNGKVLMNTLCLLIFNKTLNSVMEGKCGNTLPNDLIVPLSSQEGFDGAAGRKTHFVNTGHSAPAQNTVVNSKVVQDTVVYLLQSANGSDFGTGFPAPSSRKIDCNTQLMETSPLPKEQIDIGNKIFLDANSSNKAIEISASSRNRTYNSTDSINLEFGTINGATPTHSIFLIGNSGWYTVPDVPPHKISVVLPMNGLVGKVLVTALTRDASGILLGDTTEIFITPTGTLDSISCNTNIIFLDTLNTQFDLKVTGYYKDGDATLVADITDPILGTTYIIGSSSVINISDDGRISAFCTGTDTITISNGSRVLKIPVQVAGTPRFSTSSSGNWMDASTWTCGVVPGKGDNIRILEGHVVVLNDAATVQTIDIATTGQLLVNNGSSTLTIGDKTNKTGKINCAGAVHIKGGKIILYGSLRMSEGSELKITGDSLVIDGITGINRSALSDRVSQFSIKPNISKYECSGEILEFISLPFGANSQTNHRDLDHVGNSPIFINGFRIDMIPAKFGMKVGNGVMHRNNKIFSAPSP